MADSPTTTQLNLDELDASPPPPSGPALPPPPPPPASNPPTPLPAGWLGATLSVGVVSAVVTGRVPLNSIGTAILVAAIAGALVKTGVASSRSERFCLLAAVVFGLLLAVRTDPRLVTFNAIAAVVSLGVAVVGPQRLFDWRPLQLLGDAVSIAFHPFVMAADLLPSSGGELDASSPDRSGRRQLAIGTVQGLAIAVPLVIVLGALLGSADAVFADFIARGQFDAGELWLAVIRFLAGAGFVLVLIGRMTRTRSTVPEAALSLSRIPTLVVLGCLNGVFALFAAAQLYALTGAGERILTEAGLTYSSYARQGFFQLLWVAGLMLLILLSVRVVARGWCLGDRWFRWSSLTAVLLTMAVVVVAVARLQLYIADFGLTPLRFYSVVFSIWVAVGFAIVGVRLAGWRPGDAWTLPALALSGLLALLALNIANPEALIANDLVPRDGLPSAMNLLTSDGRTVVAERFDEIDPGWADDIEAQLCASVPESDTWLSWNLGRSRARSALLELC